MLDEISKYDYLGTPEYFLDVFVLLAHTKTTWTRAQLESYFSNRIYKYPYLDGGVGFLLASKLLKEDEGLVSLNIQNPPLSLADSSRVVIERLISVLVHEDDLSRLLGVSAVSLDYVTGRLVISPQAFPLRYRALRMMLVDFSVISKEDDGFGYVVGNSYGKSLFENLARSPTRKAISIEHLKANLLRQEQGGAEAEEFVIAYEKKRLGNHPHIAKVRRISEVDVAAGFDIISLNSERSNVNDRFIEVKSYSNTFGFYWTQNEINTAKLKGDAYYLYIVNRSKMSDSHYEPDIIQNPFQAVYSSDEWVKAPTVIFVTKP